MSCIKFKYGIQKKLTSIDLTVKPGRTGGVPLRCHFVPLKHWHWWHRRSICWKL